MILDYNLFERSTFDGPDPKEGDEFILWYEICYVVFPWINIPKFPSPFTNIPAIISSWAELGPAGNNEYFNPAKPVSPWTEIPKGPTGIERC